MQLNSTNEIPEEKLLPVWNKNLFAVAAKLSWQLCSLPFAEKHTRKKIRQKQLMNDSRNNGLLLISASTPHFVEVVSWSQLCHEALGLI